MTLSSCLENHDETPWIVVTGAPSSGKTTTTAALAEALDHPVRGEIATMVIRRRITGGLTLEEATRDQHDLQREIFHEGRESEEMLHPTTPIVLDRGWPDVVAYEMLYEGGRAEAWLKMISDVRRRYRHVFRLERLPFEQNDVRVDGLLADRLHELYGEVYARLGYVVTDVPVMSIEERIAFMLARLAS